MVRLNMHPEKYDGLSLENCGLLFLSTPHFGTTQADWNGFILNTVEAILGVRSGEIVEQLKSFNPSVVDFEEAFNTMRKIPPLYCLCEGEKTVAFGKARTVSWMLCAFITKLTERPNWRLSSKLQPGSTGRWLTKCSVLITVLSANLRRNSVAT